MSAPQRPGPPPPWPNQQPQHGHGQTEWIPRVSGPTGPQPRRDEPFQFEEPEPEQPPNPVATWALRIAGLVAVAVLSGFLWAYLQDDTPEGTPAAGGDGQPTQNEVPAGRFEFTAHPGMAEPKVDTDCAANSRGKVKEFFAENPCANLTRALYTSDPVEQAGITPNGAEKTVYTWVAVVEMKTAEEATELHELAQSNNTGNVTDPIIAKIVEVPGTDLTYGLGHGGYHSQLIGKYLIIVESDWAPTGDRSEEQDQFLTGVSEDALRYGKQYTDQG